jgi:hypothetical protein
MRMCLGGLAQKRRLQGHVGFSCTCWRLFLGIDSSGLFKWRSLGFNAGRLGGEVASSPARSVASARPCRAATSARLVVVGICA